MPEQKIVPNLWFNGNAEQAGEFYASALPRTSARVTSRYPENVPDFQRKLVGEALTVDVAIDGYHLTLINAGPEFPPTLAISFILNFDPLLFGGDADLAHAALDATWERLAEDGTVRTPLDVSPFSARYGWVQDRYGVNWQLMLTDPEGEPRPFVIPQLIFAGPAQNRAREATEFYLSLFQDAQVGNVVPYPAAAGPAAAGAVMFGEFQLAGQWFAMMDSRVELGVTFTPGVSLEIRCADQSEINHFWDALSAVPEAEQCGWLVDRYGVSWQVTPRDMDQLMQRPGAYEHLMAMKKLIIADF